MSSPLFTWWFFLFSMNANSSSTLSDVLRILGYLGFSVAVKFRKLDLGKHGSVQYCRYLTGPWVKRRRFASVAIRNYVLEPYGRTLAWIRNYFHEKLLGLAGLCYHRRCQQIRVRNIRGDPTNLSGLVPGRCPLIIAGTPLILAGDFREWETVITRDVGGDSVRCGR